MTLEDPFFVVKDEVFKALNKTRGLYLRWVELQDDSVSITKDEIEWTNTELKNSLRSIEWDLEDLEDTIDIVEKNTSKFKIDNKEITTRKHFIDTTKNEVKSMKENINMNRNRDRDHIARQPLLDNSPAKVTNLHNSTKYSKLENEVDSPHRQFLNDSIKQQHYLRRHDGNSEELGGSLGTSKVVSRHIGVDMDEQTGMLDEFGTDLENSDSLMHSTLKKTAKALGISNERTQWIVIIILGMILVIVITLFFLL